MAANNTLKICCYLLLLLVESELSSATERKCGRALTEALDVICQRGFNTKIKKSLDFGDYAYNEIEDELPYPYANSPFLPKMFADSANSLAKTRRRRHGIYDECCRKGCSFMELKSYCL